MKPRYIDANNIRLTGLTFSDVNNEVYFSLTDVRKAIEQTPTEDVVEVKHGYWYISEYEYLNCSECGGDYFTGCDSTAEAKERLAEGDYYPYCPYCGAKMDGERGVE